MKVLILTADSNGGYPVPAAKGGAVSTLIEHLVTGNNEKQCCDMEILSFYDPEAERKAAEKYSNTQFTWVKVPSLLKFLDKCAFQFIRAVKKNEKVISFRSPFSLLYYIGKAKKVTTETDADKIVIENNIPLVRVMRGNKYKGQWYYHFHNVPRIDAGCREEFQKVTKFLCVSQYVADQITGENSAIGRIPPEKTAVLYNCVDTDLFRPIDKNDSKIVRIKKKYGFTDDDCICIFAGRLSEEKGVDILLEALQKTSNNVKCLIVGSLLSEFNSMTDYQKKLYFLAEKMKNRVVFTGYINQNELPFYYNVADIAVLPSMWDEPAGLTNIEAISCGIHVITTEAGGIPEYVNAGANILLKRTPNIVNEISDSIYKLDNNKESVVCSLPEKFSIRNYIDNFVEKLKQDGDAL